MTRLVILPAPSLPALIAAAGDRAQLRFLEFFASNIRNPHTRRAYVRAATEFLGWCAAAGVVSLSAVEPLHVSAWVEAQTRALSAPTVKQRLAAIRHLFDWLVTGQIVSTNPASSVRDPSHVAKTGKTPVLNAEEARRLLANIDTSTHAGLRDRALIALMVYAFARIGAALGMNVEDVYTQNRRFWFFESFFLRHNLGRYGDTIHGHKGFAGYYFVVLPLILLPFTGWFLRLLPALKETWADPLDRFLWLWFFAVFVFFSFSGTKLPHYLLYGTTPLFILMARHRALLASRWLAFLPPLAFFALLLFLPEMVDLAAARTDKAHELALFAEGRQVLDGAYRLAVAGALALLLVVAAWRGVGVWQGLVLAGLIQTLVVYGALVPRVFEVLQGPVKEAALLARELNLPTVVYRTSMPSFSLYRQAITPQRDPLPGDLVFLRVDKLEKLAADFPGLGQEVVFRKGPVALVRMTAGRGDG